MYVHYLPLRLPTLWIVLTHAGSSECSPFEQRTVLGNLKAWTFAFFSTPRPATSSLKPHPPPLPFLALEPNLTLPFRYRLGSSSRIWTPIFHRPPLRFCQVLVVPIPILCPPHHTSAWPQSHPSPQVLGSRSHVQTPRSSCRHHSSDTVLEANIG